MRALIFGGTGQLGRDLVSTAPSNLKILAVARSQADLTRPSDVTDVIRDSRPDVIINAAAYTAVDQAELEADIAFAVNAAAPGAMAAAAISIGASLVHISTDYVFGGAGSVPRKTTDPVCPESVYGKSKADGERAVLERGGPRATVVRTSWLYSRHGRNFVLTMLRLMRSGAPLRVVSDQTGTPTWTTPLAKAIWTGVQRGAEGGIVHWTDAGATTWYEFAVEIARRGAEYGLLPDGVEVSPVATSEYPARARRPSFSVLDLSETPAKWGAVPTPWTESLRMMLEELTLE